MTIPFSSTLVTVPELDSLVRKIYSTTLTANAASFDVSGISSAYTHLEIILTLRGTISATSTDFGLRFNGDTAENYDWFSKFGAVRLSTYLFMLADPITGESPIPGASARTNRFAVYRILLGSYSNTAIEKSAICDGGFISYQDGLGGHGQLAGGWRSTAAINRITVAPRSGSFAIGSSIAIYGMGTYA